MKRLIKSSTESQINLSEYEYVTNVDGYQVYRKIVTDESGERRGVWVAQDQDRQHPPFAITYRQARGYDPITEYETNARKLGREIGQMLFGDDPVMSSMIDPEDSKDYAYMTYSRGGRRYGVHLYSDNPLYPSFTISEIHPYDDAEYAWARCGYCGAACVEFVKNGKVIDKMQWNTYDEDDYENSEDYLNEMIDHICIELKDMNRNVKPIIIHN